MQQGKIKQFFVSFKTTVASIHQCINLEDAAIRKCVNKAVQISNMTDRRKEKIPQTSKNQQSETRVIKKSY